MAAPVQTGMEKQDMKRLLSQSKKEPVNCAIGLGPDAAFGLLLLDKNKSTTTLKKQLEAIPGAKTTRWGTARVDPDEDPKLVKITVNKELSGIARKLAKTLKGTGISKVMLLGEDGTVLESAQEEEEEQAEGQHEEQQSAPTTPPPPPSPPPQPTAQPDGAALARELAELVKRIPQVVALVPARKDALAKLAADANVQIKTGNLVNAKGRIEQLAQMLEGGSDDQLSAPLPPPTPPPQAQQTSQPDGAALARELAELVKRIPQVAALAPASKAELTKLATDANVLIKTRNLNDAKATIGQLAKALDAEAREAVAAQGQQQPQQPQPNGQQTGPEQTTAPRQTGDGSVVAYAKARLAWLAARKKIESDIDKLQTAIASTYQQDGIAGQLEQAYRQHVGPVLQNLDESLADKLDAATNATDAGTRAQLVGEAKSIMQLYNDYLGNPLIADLDGNPFVPLAIRQTIGGTLAVLEKTVR